MTRSSCIHGLDERFCSICNKGVVSGRPPRSSAGTVTLAEILQFLNENRIRATYKAVADVIGVIPRSVGALLGDRRPDASWIVSANDGLPTGYSQPEIHPELFRTNHVIASGTELLLRLSAWRAR